MNDPALVRGFERLDDLLRDRQRLGDRHGPLRDPIGKRRPLDELHDQRAAFLDPIEMRDVRVIQRGQNFGFALKARQALGVRGQGGGEHLDRHLALQRHVGGAVDLAHAAGANLGGYLIGTDTGTRAERQAAILSRRVNFQPYQESAMTQPRNRPLSIRQKIAVTHSAIAWLAFEDFATQESHLEMSLGRFWLRRLRICLGNHSTIWEWAANSSSHVARCKNGGRARLVVANKS